ncbi:MAG: hypothetical protein AW07_04170 [Candidatus Accumulibacter sp. SK-11]|nr:MAG: hypothetical protein AW07_04170 [Candidatus Accumulibacter sp. SK-11]
MFNWYSPSVRLCPADEPSSGSRLNAGDPCNRPSAPRATVTVAKPAFSSWASLSRKRSVSSLIPAAAMNCGALPCPSGTVTCAKAPVTVASRRPADSRAASRSTMKISPPSAVPWVLPMPRPCWLAVTAR